MARGPHAARLTFSNGPPVYFATTARKRMLIKHGLHPCYVTVAGDVALVLVSVRFHTDIIKLHHVLFNNCYH